MVILKKPLLQEHFQNNLSLLLWSPVKGASF